jgi:hypothetical protein
MMGLLKFTASLGLICLFGSCALMPPLETNNSRSNGNLTPREQELIQRGMVALPLPSNPKYIVTRQTCLFFVQHPEDKSMIPVGLLEPRTYLILRRKDGDWMDVQLTSGQLGSVVGANIRSLTDREDSVKPYLEPQLEFKPLALPQASTNTSEMDPVLLGG